MFNFKDQQVKISQKQTSDGIKNLRKELPKQSPFRYGSKKISFNVKSRSDYWDDIEKVYTNERARINAIIGNVLQNFMNGKGTDYDITDSAMYSPVSPVLAVTLIMLNKALFRCKIFDDYMESDEAQVYAYTHWNGKNFVTDPTALVIDNPFGNETEKYMRILPGYNKINVMNFYRGYQIYMTDYSSDAEIDSDYATVSDISNFWGSYHIDTKRFQRIFATKPDLKNCSGSVADATIKDSSGEYAVTLNMHPEIDSYLYADGIFKKLMDSPYNSQSYQISVLRGGYGFGPINIACFLKAKEFDIERITDIISGLLIAEDSGMSLIDAIRGIQEWRKNAHEDDIDTIFDSLSDIRMLRYIEYIGSIFFTAILGSSLKEKPLINIPLTSDERNIYDIGYLMGHNHDIFVQMFKNGIKNKIWLKDSTEIFSFEVPCVLYGTEPTTGIFKIGDYVKNYSDSLLIGSEPLDYAFNVSSILEKEKNLTEYIIPRKGYTIFDFVTKGLNNCLITEIIKNIDKASSTKIHLQTFENSGYSHQTYGDVTSNLQLFISPDFLLCPRIDQSTSTHVLDLNKARIHYDVRGHTAKLNGKLINNIDIPSAYCLFTASSSTASYIIDDDISTKTPFKLMPLNLTINEYNEKTDEWTLKFSFIPGDFIYVKNKRYRLPEYSFEYSSVIYIDSECITPLTTTPLTKDKDFKNANDLFVKVEETNGNDTYYKLEREIASTIGKLSNIYVLDESDNMLHKLTIRIDNPDRFVSSCSYGEIIDNQSILKTYIIGSAYGTQNHKFLTEKYDAYLNYSLQRSIKMVFNACGFYFLTSKTSHWSSNNTSNIDTRYPETINFINRFGLCILKLSVINAFCTSYSIDLQSLPDSTRLFYNIYKSYLSDFIDIRQEIQN